MHRAVIGTLGLLPVPLRRTLTWDQGTEMARHLEITAATGIAIYFCDAATRWQRGSNEHTNGLLRQYFPSPPTWPGTPRATSPGSSTNTTSDLA